MRISVAILIGVLLLSLIVAGCGGSGSLGDPVKTLEAGSQSVDPAPAVDVTPAVEDRMPTEFELGVLAESFIDGSTAESLELLVEESASQVAVSVMATGARELKALYFELGYDGNRYSPIGVEPSREFGTAEETLTLSVLEQRGLVHHGQVLANFYDKAGFSGDGVLAIVRFAKEPAPAGRIVSAPPVKDASKPLLAFDIETFSLFWGFSNQGDYDQNSETNVADLTPIGANFKEVGDWEYFSIEAVVDGDLNGEINISDITPIGANFKRRVLAYNVYAAPTLDDYPAANDVASTIDMLGTVLYDEAEGNRGEARLVFRFDLTDQPFDEYYWVRPADGDDEGTPSAAVFHDSEPLLPVMSLIADPTDGDVPLAVDFDASGTTSPLGDIADFSWDLDGDGTFGETDNGEDIFQGANLADYTYVDPAMYSPAVQVTGPKGLMSTLSVDIFAAVTPPVANITGAPTTGKAPLTVNFDASASMDPDGTIVKYEWDYDGDGTFDEDTDTTPTASFEFTTQGDYDTTVRVTDNHGATDTAAMSETGGGSLSILPMNVAPEAAISVSPLSGTIPLLVNMDASASTDSDGTIVQYEWDFEGDGSYDETTVGPTTSHTFTVADDYDPTVRVTDDDGATDIAKLSDTVTGGLNVMVPPVADINVSPLSGTVPLLVSMDATGSTDADGTIVQYEWDFEGDGTYDESGTSAMTSFTFTAGGDFDPTVRVTDDDGLTDVAKLSDTVTGGLDLLEAPTAAISGSPLTGTAPITVNFDASASTDNDGTIVQYEWDWEGDGTYDETGASATTSHEYATGGDYDPTVRVTDDDGLTDTASLSDTVPGGLDILQPPTAAITGAPLTGTAPITVNFDASGSTDVDGTIVQYEWDWEGDGTYDETGVSATTSHEYATGGDYDPTVRVTDDDGLTDTAKLSDTVPGGLDILQPPTAAITAAPLTGSAPLTVNFDASGSTDVDGTIVQYEWDWEGDGTYEETGASATTSHEYATGGDFDPTVRVTDDDGLTDTASLSDTVPGGLNVLDPPTADITATPTSGDFPLLVSFDASGSTDPDGTIDLYEWDLDYNGSFETSTGTTDNVDSTYVIQGTHTISVRVTDDDGLTDTASVDITVDTGFSFGTAVADVTMDSKASIAQFGTSPSEFAGLAYKDAASDDLYYVTASDSTSLAWNSPIAVLTSGQVGNECDLANIGGNPGIVHRRSATKVHYIYSTNSSGTSWVAPIEVANGGGAGAFSSLAYINGKPAISFVTGGQDDLYYVQATTSTGASASDWPTPTQILAGGGGDEFEFTEMHAVNGNPAVGFNFIGADTGLKFMRATDVDGGTWGSQLEIDEPLGGGRWPSMDIVSGFPAMAYNAFDVDQLRYCRAVDADGSAMWDTPIVVDSGTDVGQWCTMAVSGGMPIIAYYDGGNGDLKFARASDAVGTSWLVVPIDTIGDVGEYASMALVEGLPVIAYYDATNTALKVAVLN